MNLRCPNIRIFIVLAAATIGAHGQWLNYPSPGTPRIKNGKPNLSAPAPRLSKGVPDLSGVWQVEAPDPAEMERLFRDIGTFVVPGDDSRTFSKYFFDVLVDFKREEAPLRPEAAAVFQSHARSFGQDSPGSHCLPLALPAAALISVPFKIVQTPGLIVILYEVDNTFRQIYTDGRPLPADPQPSWLGYSVGKWVGDALVVDTIGFNDKSWLDAIGHPHSEALKIQERYRRRDFGHMELQITLDDPRTFTKPFNLKATELLVPDSDILENFCAENERDRAHFGDK